jgi:hypothetical protein
MVSGEAAPTPSGGLLTGDVVAIYGVDIQPRFQAVINIEEIGRESFDFMAVKVSEGVDSSYLAAGSAGISCSAAARPACCVWGITTWTRETRKRRRKHSPKL